MSGNIVIRPLTAKLTRNTEFFGKMDPLVKVLVGSRFQQSGIARKGHKCPGWETELVLRRLNEDIIHFEVWDKDILKGDLIGSGDLSFSKIFQMGNRVSGWIPLFYKGKDAGELLVDVQFIPDVSQQPIGMGSENVQKYSTVEPQKYSTTEPQKYSMTEAQIRPTTIMQENYPKQVYKGVSEVSEKVSTTGIGPVEAGILHTSHCSYFPESGKLLEGEKKEYKEGEILTKKYETLGGEYKPIFGAPLKERTDFENLGNRPGENIIETSTQKSGQVFGELQSRQL